VAALEKRTDEVKEKLQEAKLKLETMNELIVERGRVNVRWVSDDEIAEIRRDLDELVRERGRLEEEIWSITREIIIEGLK